MIVSKPRILVVDDDDMVLRSCERSLRLHGFEPVTAFNGKEAIKLAQEQEFDAVVSDVMMPRMNGLELRRAIIEKVPALDGKFVFVTGGHTPGLEVELKKYPHLQKPYSNKDLFALLQKMTE
jgi:two-component system NtrC family sensor kinase